MKLILILAGMYKQNCRIWAQNTRRHTLKMRGSQNESLFGANFGIIGPFFLENGQGEAVTVNDDRYRAMLFTKI